MENDVRPNWDHWFLSLCFVVSERSLDPSTKHGCVVVSEDKTILSVGFNGPPRGIDDSVVPLTRPEKYDWLIHSEDAAIINAARHGINLFGSTFYITGKPCEICFGKIISVGAKKIIHGPVTSACVNEKSKLIIDKMNSKNQIELIEVADFRPVILENSIKRINQYLQKAGE
jgi:dCMP deaminase